jgi:DNA polymerase-3 subunit delta
VILKSYIVEQQPKLLSGYKSVLLYGENEGIKNDIKSKLKDFNKGSEIIIFFENEILKDNNILYKNVINESLFNETKIIFIHSASDKIFNEISESLVKVNNNVKIYIFSDSLDKKSKLRVLFEKEKNLAVFACYVDNERTLINYINKELIGYKGVTGELLNIIIGNSGSNRKIIQNEIVKIKNFFLEKKINKNDLIEILNIKSDTRFEEIRDNALIGKKDKINKLLSETDLQNEDSLFYLNNINYRILNLIEIQKNSKILNDYENALENFKPQIFWKDKPMYVLQLKKWSLEKLNRIAQKICQTEILMKKNSDINNEIVIKELVISLSREASTSY